MSVVKNEMDKVEQRLRARETFTVIDANGEIREDVRVITALQEEQARKIKELKIYKQTSENPFVFVEMGAVNKLSTLDNKMLGYFLVLQTYIDYNNMLRNRGDKLPMKNVEIRRALNISNRGTFNKIMAQFEEMGLLYRKDVELYGKQYEAVFINNEYCFRKGISGENKGKNTKSAVRVFLDSLQDVYAQEKVNAGDVGIIYRAIEFLHLESNILVTNPFERDLLFAQALSIKEFAKSLKITKDALYKKIRDLTYPCEYNGELLELKVFAKITVGNEKVLKLNPLLACRQSGSIPKDVYAEFILEYNNRSK
ncbi:hypothetical protein [Pseudobacillus badius]|uniref:hypothetical protein n=1 Tax=Bacillus badius TaxID=1455 RepID=UPI0024A365B9|nr:hypothetical protein [Bacillus badius]GLY12507.1 hypothetical protein Bbad01_37230 [Bacillus badius]